MCRLSYIQILLKICIDPYTSQAGYLCICLCISEYLIVRSLMGRMCLSKAALTSYSQH